MRTCAACGAATKRRTAKYCSRACFRAAVKVRKPCASCGQPVSASKRKFCSNACKDAGRRGPLHRRWNGGRWQRGTGDCSVWVWTGEEIHTPGNIRRAEREHRVVCASAIGRRLHSWELVIHISREMDDNRPDNLFVCGSRAEYSRRRQGALPWPSASNLGTYADREPENHPPPVPRH